jgi:hypothetical protein
LKEEPSALRKDNFGKSGMFFGAEKCPPAHHVYHTKNHNLTIKKPRSAPAFRQNRLQKPPFPGTKK